MCGPTRFRHVVHSSELGRPRLSRVGTPKPACDVETEAQVVVTAPSAGAEGAKRHIGADDVTGMVRMGGGEQVLAVHVRSLDGEVEQNDSDDQEPQERLAPDDQQPGRRKQRERPATGPLRVAAVGAPARARRPPQGSRKTQRPEEPDLRGSERPGLGSQRQSKASHAVPNDASTKNVNGF